MSKIKPGSPGDGGRTEYLQLREDPLVFEAERWNDRRSNTEPVQRNFVLVGVFVTMQKPAGQFKVDPVLAKQRPGVARINILAWLAERVIKMGEAIQPAVVRFKLKADELRMIDMFRVRVPMLGDQGGLKAPFGNFHCADIARHHQQY